MDPQTGIVFLFGTFIGSFLNVCIYRLPRGESVVSPGSRCHSCKQPIPLWHNIPVVSYLVLRGKCRTCKAAIGFTYPVVEILTGVLLVLVWWHYGPTSSFLHYSLLVLLLLPISFIDLDTKLILNVLTLPGIGLGFTLAFVLGHISPIQAMQGLFVGGGFLWFVGMVGQWLFKKESMGGGDVKLGAMIGVFIGPEVLVALFLSFFLAFPVILVGFGTRRLSVGSTVPFGPFISLATVVVICFGETLYTQYLKLIGPL